MVCSGDNSRCEACDRNFGLNMINPEDFISGLERLSYLLERHPSLLARRRSTRFVIVCILACSFLP